MLDNSRCSGIVQGCPRDMAGTSHETTALGLQARRSSRLPEALSAIG